MTDRPQDTKISQNSRNHTTRQSLPNEPRKRIEYRRTRSHNYGKDKRISVGSHTPPTIKEEDEDVPVVIVVEEPSTPVKTEPSSILKKNSVTSLAIDNPAYEGPSLSRKGSRVSLSEPNFDRNDESLRSSRRDLGSVASMEVQIEQYCCFSRWSPCERRLALVVAILGAIILCLVSVVGYLADRKPDQMNLGFSL